MEKFMTFADLFWYNPKTGLLTWKVSRSNRIKVGQVAGSIQTNHKGKPYECQYLHVRVDGKFFYVHHIAVEIMTGKPPRKQVDHRDGNGLNNKWSNLRNATHSQNMGNRGRNRSRKHNLPKGIGWHPRDQAYTVRVAGKFVKQCKSLNAARTAYKAASEKYFGEFAR